MESSSDKNATDFYQKVTRSDSSIGVGLPSLPLCSKIEVDDKYHYFQWNSHCSSLHSTIFKFPHNLPITQFLMNGIGVVIDLENVLSPAENEQTIQSIAEFYESDVDLSMLNKELAQIRFCTVTT